MISHFSHIIGNEHIKRYLVRMAEKNAIANTLLFSGPDGVGKKLFAEAFAKMLLCSNDPEGTHRRKVESGNHPDIRIFHPEGKIGMHSIDTMRQLSEEVYLSPYEAQKKVFIIQDAERMLSYSSNALLKTFEEPPSWCIIILLTSNPETMLPTILSRCCMLRFHTLSENEIIELLRVKWQKKEDEAKMLAAFSGGSAGKAFKLVDKGGDPIRERLLTLLSQGKMQTYIKLMEAASEISNQIEATKQSVEEAARESLLKSFPKDLTSSQKHLIDKEVDGIIAMQFMQDAQSLFDVILYWYRDVELVAANGCRSFLLNPDFQDAIEQVCQRGDSLSLEVVQKAISQARLALERSTSLQHCLENLFLDLNLL